MLHRPLAVRANEISPSPTLSIDAKTKELIQAGRPVINLSAGEPDFPTPANVAEAGIAAIRSGFTKYTAAQGTVGLRTAICRKLLTENGLSYQPEQVVVSSGAKQSLYNALMVLCQPGDEVIVPVPWWVSYPEIVKLTDARPVFVPTDASRGFALRREMVEPYITARTRAIIINSPNNPTGAVYSEEDLRGLAALAVEHGLWVIADEIYEKLVYDGASHVSIASLGPQIKAQTIVINGMSKAFAMTGWRIGYAASEPEVAAAMTALQSHTTSNPNSIAQKAALAALTGPQEAVAAMVAAFDERRRAMVAALRALPGVRCEYPAGAFYAFADVRGLVGRTIRGRPVTDDYTLAEILLEEAMVATVPGTAFGLPGFLRLSYAASLADIQEAMRRLDNILREA